MFTISLVQLQFLFVQLQILFVPIFVGTLLNFPEIGLLILANSQDVTDPFYYLCLLSLKWEIFDLDMFTAFHEEWNELTDFINRYSTSILSIESVDPLTFQDCTNKYRDLMEIQMRVKEVFEHLNHTISCTERIILYDENPKFHDLYKTLILDREKLKSADNNLVTALKHLETIIHDVYPDYRLPGKYHGLVYRYLQFYMELFLSLFLCSFIAFL